MEIAWDSHDDAEGNRRHILEHGITPEEVETVLFDPTSETTTSRSTARPITFGYTMKGRYLAVVWEFDGRRIRPITAYDAPKPRRGRKGK